MTLLNLNFKVWLRYIWYIIYYTLHLDMIPRNSAFNILLESINYRFASWLHYYHWYKRRKKVCNRNWISLSQAFPLKKVFQSVYRRKWLKSTIFALYAFRVTDTITLSREERWFPSYRNVNDRPRWKVRWLWIDLIARVPAAFKHRPQRR